MIISVAAGIQIGNTVITSYIVDSYPLQSMSVITFYSVFLNLSAFIDPVSLCFSPLLSLIHKHQSGPRFNHRKANGQSQFFIAPWEAANGFTLTFAAQGILTFFLSVPVIAGLHRFGPGLRQKSGRPSWVNPEYDAL